MSQVLCSQFCFFGPGIEFVIEFVETAAEICVGGRELRQDGAQSGAKYTRVGSAEEPSGAQADAGQAISMSLRDTLDHSMKAQAAELVSHPALGQFSRLHAEQRG